MSDINLLPEELRSKEEKELKKLRKKSKEIIINLTEPIKVKPVGGKGFWQKLFGKKVTQKPVFYNDDKEIAKPIDVFKKEEKKEPLKERVDFFGKSNVTESTRFEKVPEILPKPPRPEIKITQAPKSQADVKPKEVTVVVKEPPKSQKDLVKKSEKLVSEKSKEKPSYKPESASIPQKNFFSGVRSIIYKILRKQDDALGVDLLPEQVLGLGELNWLRILLVLLTYVLVAFIIGLTSLGYLQGEEKRKELEVAEVQYDIFQLQNDITKKSVARDDLLLLQQKMTLAKELIDNHVHWSKFFSLLETYTLDGVHYNSFSGTTQAPIIINGTAQNLQTLFWQREVLSDARDFVRSVEIGNVQPVPESGMVNFVLTLVVDPLAFRK